MGKCETHTKIKMQKYKCLLGYANYVSCPPPGLSKHRNKKFQFFLFFWTNLELFLLRVQ